MAASQMLNYLGLVAQREKVTLPADLAIDDEVDLYLDGGEFFLGARLNVSIPGVERSVAQELVNAAAKVCPYSKVISGNADVEYNVV